MDLSTELILGMSNQQTMNLAYEIITTSTDYPDRRKSSPKKESPKKIELQPPAEESDCSTDSTSPFPVFESWQEIITYYHRFLSGALQECPTHGGPLEEESDAIKEQLLAINRLGVLTVDSQPGLLERKEKGEIYWHDRMRHATQIEFRQRAALLCFMYRPLLEKLKKAFAKKDHLIFSQRAKLEGGSKMPKSFIPITATSFVYHGKERDHVYSQQSVDGWISDDMGFILEGAADSTKKEVMKDLYQVHLLDPIWGRPTQLFDDLIVALSS